jgi:hypothetical protein
VKISKELTYNGVKLGENTADSATRSKFDALAAQATKTDKNKQL